MGLDRRTIPLALVVLGVMLLFMVVIPAVNDAVGWDDEVVAGDVIDLGDGVTFVPPVGWSLTAGIRTSDEPSSGINTNANTVGSVGSGGVTVTVERGRFDGTATELLDQVNRVLSGSDAAPNRAFKVTGPSQTVSTAAGLTGVSEAYTSESGEGRILAFILDAGADRTVPTGVTITIDGTDKAYATHAAEIDALTDSLTYEETAE